jgi:hypothetical protein
VEAMAKAKGRLDLDALNESNISCIKRIDNSIGNWSYQYPQFEIMIEGLLDFEKILSLASFASSGHP